MNNIRTLLLIVMSLVILCAATIVAAQDDGTRTRIENAMSAAPHPIARDATVMDINAEGEVVVLKEGTNEWTCWPDLPISPDNDPMCFDPVVSQWFDALLAGTDPGLTNAGLAYLLQGGMDPTSTDPFALAPAESKGRIATSPHVMIVFPKDYDLSDFSTDHSHGGPYVMWLGTPFQHIMMPVDVEGMAPSDLGHSLSAEIADGGLACSPYALGSGECRGLGGGPACSPYALGTSECRGLAGALACSPYALGSGECRGLG